MWLFRVHTGMIIVHVDLSWTMISPDSVLHVHGCMSLFPSSQASIAITEMFHISFYIREFNNIKIFKSLVTF